MKTRIQSHVPPSEQRWKVGDTGSIDEWGTKGEVTGYETSEKDATGSCYVPRSCWWSYEEQQWLMSHPTEPVGTVVVPDTLEIRPTWTEA